MAKKASQPPVEIEAAPPKTKKPRPRKKPKKAKKPDLPQELPQLEAKLEAQPEAQPVAQPSHTAPPVKAKKKPPKPKIETESWFMFPSLHQKVVEAVSTSMLAPWFQAEDTDCYRINYYETFVMGTFRCQNSPCKTKGWSSKKIALVIRGYSGSGYNAVVYNQRCRSCNSLGTLKLDEISYVERVAYRLQKWAGVHVEKPFYNSGASAPHREDLCEGCKAGVCELGSLFEDFSLS